jgi:hypothetical protein
VIQDLKQAMPELGRGLQQLLDFEGDVEATFARSFEVEYEYFGEVRRAELKPGGADIPVTRDNRQEFVRLMTSYYLDTSVRSQFSAFAAGFHEVMSLVPNPIPPFLHPSQCICTSCRIAGAPLFCLLDA